jgi:hypothetical protein
VEGHYDAPRLISVSNSPDGQRTTLTYELRRQAPRVRVEPDREKRVFRVVEPTGKTAVFRDEAVPFLVVEPDAETGEMKPALRLGEPQVLYLCREEREVR